MGEGVKTECPRCGSTSPSRALGGCFHLWHADPELRAEPSRGAPWPTNDTLDDVKRWLWGRNYHHQGDFRVTLAHGGQLDLTEVLADFAEVYFGALNARVKAWQKIVEDAVNVKPTAPILLPDPSGHVVLLEALKHALPILIGAIAFVDCKAVVAEVRAAIEQAERT